MAEKIFSLEACDGRARAGRLKTAHGEIPTPIFMPVGTAGTVKALAPDDLQALGAPIILGNAYHLYLRPGDELIARHGGLHGFASWPGAILTDSGGFQAFSLSGLRKLTPEGVEFRSHLDGSKHFFTPAKVIGIQKNLNSDIMMVLDECAPYGAEREYTEKSVDLTSAWAEEARRCWPGNGGKNLLFGIVQGGFYKDLREKSARRLTELDFDGLAVGGLSVGETKRELHEFVDFTFDMLPEEKPRYLMGVGTPLDIALGIARGVDMFDCVLPTRNARNGTLYTSLGKINIKGKAYADSGEALDPACCCFACRNFSRAYLRHLYMSRELLAYRLNTLHNLTYFLNLVREARKAILEKRYAAFLDGISSLYPDEAERSGCFGKIWA